jgi:hypothetical protein
VVELDRFVVLLHVQQSLKRSVLIRKHLQLQHFDQVLDATTKVQISVCESS